LVFFFVNYGRLAQHTAALEVSAAVFAGESSTIETMRSLRDEVRMFFKDNPAWE
jgi:hypothetical protein